MSKIEKWTEYLKSLNKKLDEDKKRGSGLYKIIIPLFIIYLCNAKITFSGSKIDDVIFTQNHFLLMAFVFCVIDLSRMIYIIIKIKK